MSNTSCENEHFSSENSIFFVFFCLKYTRTAPESNGNKNRPFHFHFHFNHPDLNFRNSTLQSRESLSTESGLFTSSWIEKMSLTIVTEAAFKKLAQSQLISASSQSIVMSQLSIQLLNQLWYHNCQTHLVNSVSHHSCQWICSINLISQLLNTLS